MMEQWEKKIGMTLTRAADAHEAGIHAQIRDRLFSMKNRMRFLEQHASDPTVASAILTAPIFLSGLSDAELRLVQLKIEEHVPAEIIEARAATQKALKEAEQGWARAIDVIAQRAGLTQGPDSTWTAAKEGNAAA
jgi:hypothetical protein